MLEDLSVIKNERWKAHEKFSDFVQYLNGLNAQEQELQKKSYLICSIPIELHQQTF